MTTIHIYNNYSAFYNSYTTLIVIGTIQTLKSPCKRAQHKKITKRKDLRT